MNEMEFPITRATRKAWARFEKVDHATGRKHTRLIQLWERQDGTTRIYFGTNRVPDWMTFHYVCSSMKWMGWTLVQRGC